jgi:hypothetical protein
VQVAVFAPEYAQAGVHAEMAPLEVRLKPGALLRLRALDEQGEPVPGTSVILEQWGEHRHALKWSAESGTDGRIEWNSAPRDAELELCAIKDGWCYSRSWRFKADGTEHIITMQRTLDASGWVTDAATGQPISRFKAFPGYGDGESAWERIDTRQATDGKFVIRFQERQTPWRVRVEAEGYQPFVSDPLPPDFREPLSVALQPVDPSKAARGIVRNPDGSPAVGAQVALLTPEHSVSLTGRPRLRREPDDKLVTVADAQGNFSFGADAKGSEVIAASASGFARLRLSDNRQPLSIQLRAWGRITGRIETGLSPAPVESVVLTAYEPGPNGSLRLDFDFAHPDASGGFAFDFVPPENVCLCLNPGLGKAFHHRTQVSVAPGQTTSLVITNSLPVSTASLGAAQ